MYASRPKREWRKPELVVVLRSRPEEAVLKACKHGRGDLGPGSTEECKARYPCAGAGGS